MEQEQLPTETPDPAEHPDTPEPAAPPDEVSALRQELRDTVERYRALVQASAPDVPPELIVGDSAEEIDASLAASLELVARVRRQVEAQLQAERVPAGAPVRAAPNLAGLSPAEKIAHALRQMAR